MSNGYYELASSLFDQLEAAKGQWRKIVRHIDHDALLAGDLQENSGGADDGTQDCSRAKINFTKLAGAHIDYIMPPSTLWFSYDEGEEQGKDALRWFSQDSEKCHKDLNASNFYAEVSMMVRDRVLGTGCILAESREGELVFKHIPFGTYAIAQNNYNEVDTLVRKFNMTPHQAALEFGEEALPTYMREALADASRRFTQEFEIWHLVAPRTNYKQGSQDVHVLDQRWASVYIDVREKAVILESGYYEFPYGVSRFLRKGGQVYGSSPAADVLTEIKELPVLREVLKTLGQRAAYPALLTLAEQVGEIDMRAGGQTIVTPEALRLNAPREWATAGNFDVGLKLIEMDYDELDSAMYIKSLQIISNIDRPMTATEVNAREAEKVQIFVPTFVQFMADWAPFMKRILALRFRLGKVNREGLPEGVLRLVADEHGMQRVEVVAPRVKYIGRLAQAIERSQQFALNGVIESALTLAQQTGREDILDPFDFDYISTWLYRNSGAPSKGLTSEKEVKRIREARAQAQQAQAQAQQAQQLAAAQRDLSQSQQTPQQTPQQI